MRESFGAFNRGDTERLLAVVAPDLVMHLAELPEPSEAPHAGELQGIPASGREIAYVSHEFYRVEDGLSAEEWICSDMASVFRQLT